MTVSATTPINQTQTTGDTTSTGRTRLAENFDMFLTLLTTQLKNQDPTAPMDSNQFMSQLVQMTSVEQQLAGNELLQQLVANTGTSLGSVVSLIGKEVRAETPDARLSNGEAKWGYNLETAADDVKIEVLDAQGIPVRTIAAGEADRKAGDHSFIWDGKSDSGAAQPDGVYTLRITAKDPGGEALKNSIFVQGIVTGVEQENGLGTITVNGGKVALSAVTSVKTAPEAPSAPDETDNTTGSGGDEVATDPDPTNPADQTSA
jgi:flagellar basal-body rod modification protein FlgD